MKERIISDLYNTSKEIYKIESTNVVVNWSWYDQSQGLVEWTFQNISVNAQISVTLLRNGYYFGGAFWPIYEANAGFDTQFIATVTPLVDNGVQNNSPPLGLLHFTTEYSVAFIFTLAPGQVWSMLEGGFSQLITPSQVSVWELTQEATGQFCIGYDPLRVTDWDAQTGTNLQGYSPNPSTFMTIAFATDNAPLDLLPFNDNISTGTCSATTPSPPSPNTCITQLEQGITELKSGQTIQGIEDILGGINCLYSSGLLLADIKEHVKSFLSKL